MLLVVLLTEQVNGTHYNKYQFFPAPSDSEPGKRDSRELFAGDVVQSKSNSPENALEKRLSNAPSTEALGVSGRLKTRPFSQRLDRRSTTATVTIAKKPTKPNS